MTRGEHGMTLLRPGHPALHLPARAREVFDVTGAGDTVISTLAGALAAGEDLPQAVALANLAAGIVVGKLGTAAISAPELRRAVQREQGSERGVLGLEQLLLTIEDARAHGEKIVFTRNGCFDILHAGHVSYLEQARAQGDRLIVAVNDDASVSRLKGPGRPINSVDPRMAVLAGLEAVDSGGALLRHAGEPAGAGTPRCAGQGWRLRCRSGGRRRAGPRLWRRGACAGAGRTAPPPPLSRRFARPSRALYPPLSGRQPGRGRPTSPSSQCACRALPSRPRETFRQPQPAGRHRA
ncbi:Bifunctional protein HldE [Stutzerimonas stutzeri]